MKTKNVIVPRYLRKDGNRSEILTLVKIESAQDGKKHIPSGLGGTREVDAHVRGFAVAVARPDHGPHVLSSLDGYELTGKIAYRRAKKAPPAVLQKLLEWDTYDSLEPIKEAKEKKPSRKEKKKAGAKKAGAKKAGAKKAGAKKAGAKKAGAKKAGAKKAGAIDRALRRSIDHVLDDMMDDWAYSGKLRALVGNLAEEIGRSPTDTEVLAALLMLDDRIGRLIAVDDDEDNAQMWKDDRHAVQLAISTLRK